MGLGLSNKDVAALNTAITVLLAPLSVDESDDWRRAVSSALEVLDFRSGSATGRGFRASFINHLGFGRRKALLISFIKSAPVGVTLYNPNGLVMQQNRVMESLLQNDPEGRIINAEARRLSLQVTRAQAESTEPQLLNSTAVAEMRTARFRYRISATFVEDGVLSGHACALAVTERLGAPSLNTHQVAIRFGLTKREAEAARLMGRGCSNREIALTLGISVNTARRHSERILSKLDVHSKAEAAVRLNGS